MQTQFSKFHMIFSVYDCSRSHAIPKGTDPMNMSTFLAGIQCPEVNQVLAQHVHQENRKYNRHRRGLQSSMNDKNNAKQHWHSSHDAFSYPLRLTTAVYLQLNKTAEVRSIIRADLQKRHTFKIEGISTMLTSSGLLSRSFHYSNLLCFCHLWTDNLLVIFAI